MKVKASLTLYAALSIMLIAQFIFVLLEAARYQEICKLSEMRTEANLEAMFAAYCSPLWEEYHLLAINGGDGEGEFAEALLQGIIDYQNYEIEQTDGIDLIRFKSNESKFDAYSLLTDDDGMVFYKSVTEYMKENILYEEAKFIYSYYQSTKGLEDGGEYSDSSISDAIDGLNNPGKYENDEANEDSNKQYGSKIKKYGKFKETLGTGNSSKEIGISEEKSISEEISTSEEISISEEKSISDAESTENPLDQISSSQNKGILELIVSDDEKISEAVFADGERLSERQKNTGTSQVDDSADWYGRVLFEQYLINYMGCYTAPKDSHALAYELEYIVGGKDSDIENLKSVVRRLLAIREGANMLYLMSDTAKSNEALSLATSLAGASANPLLIEAVKYGLLAGWAYCESILDLRALLQGDRIPAIKSNNTWTSDLSAIGSLLSGNAKAKSSTTGINYKEYVGLLVLLKGNSQLSYRAMDLMENSIRKEVGYENVRMDNMISSIDYSCTYEYDTIFSNFINLIGGTKTKFTKTVTKSYGYYKKNS